MSSTVTATISLPRTLAERARKLSRREDRTVRVSSWDAIRASLLTVGSVGKKANLGKFVIKDRCDH